MKIFPASDLHLEFAQYLYIQDRYKEKAFPEADVGLLAGDIFNLHHKENYECYEKFFSRINDAFHRTFIIAGNHTFYHKDINCAIDDEKEFLHKFDNIKYLDNESEFYNGVLFVGSTLWSDFNNENPLTMEICRNSMNDYRLIKDGKRRINPQDTLDLFKENRAWLRGILDDNQLVDKIVIMTHHSPSFQGVVEQYRDDFHINGAYHSNMEFLMNNKVKLWHHGHTHIELDYKINDTRVICNPTGYMMVRGFGYYENPKFDPYLVVEV